MMLALSGAELVGTPAVVEGLAAGRLGEQDVVAKVTESSAAATSVARDVPLPAR